MDGALQAIDLAPPAQRQVMRWLVESIATQLQRPALLIDVHAPLFDLGLESAQIVGLTAQLSERLGHPLDAAFFLRHPSIAEVANAVARMADASAPSQEPDLMRRHAPACVPAPPAREDEIVIVGMAGRFPPGGRLQEFWNHLLAGHDGIRPGRPGRGDAASEVQAGWLEEVEQFDAPFFKIAPAEAAEMDPQQRLTLQVAWEALEDAGLTQTHLREHSVGVFIGASHSEFRLQRVQSEHPVSNLTPTGTALSVIANRLSYCFDFTGPSMAVDTACSSSLVALHLACQSLRTGESDFALVGGSNLLISPSVTQALEQAGMLSPSSRCRSFDAKADGYVRGEGVGILVLCRRSAAAVEDRIYARVRATACNQDGRSSALTAPNPAAQERLLARALQQAGMEAGEVHFVEAHGSATALGDPIEVNAIAGVYGAGRSKDAPLWLGSVKSNIGHLEAASGIAGLIKAALAIHHRRLPRSLHVASLNPHVRWNDASIAVPTETVQLGAPGSPVIGAVSSFGFGGTNAHALLSSPDVRSSPFRKFGALNDRPGRDHIVLLSARSSDQLEITARQWSRWLRETSDATLEGVSYTSLARRTRWPLRVACRGRSAEGIAQSLQELVDSGELRHIKPAPAQARVGLLLESLPCHDAKLVAALPWEEPLWRSVFARCADALSACSVLDLPVIGQRMRRGEQVLPIEQRVFEFAAMLALAELLYSHGLQPARLLTKDLGEGVARCLARTQSVGEAMSAIACEAGFESTGSAQTAFDEIHAWVVFQSTDGKLALPGTTPQIQLTANSAGAPDDALGHLLCQLVRFGLEIRADGHPASGTLLASLPPYPWHPMHFPIHATSGYSNVGQQLIPIEPSTANGDLHPVPPMVAAAKVPEVLQTLIDAQRQVPDARTLSSSLTRGTTRRRHVQGD